MVAFSEPPDGEERLAIVPFVHGEDTILCCSDIISLYSELSIQVIPFRIFTDKLYQSCRLNQPFPISDDYYNFLDSLDCIVKYDEVIDGIYHNGGIDGLLNYFNSLDHRSRCFMNERTSVNYLAYLLWVNGYVLGTDDESASWHVFHN